jgi:hypothetical protein
MGLIEAGPDPLAQTTSLGQIIAASADAPVHILFVHGLRTGDRGASNIFRANLTARLTDILVATEPSKTELTHRLDIGARPDLTYMGRPIWPEEAAWAMGPFVDRYEYARKTGGHSIIVDEVNWWPLALPLRCRALLEPEAYLAGADMANLRLCAAVDSHGQPLDDDIHYPYLTKAKLDKLLDVKPVGGGAALANGVVKRALVDWGLSDAAIALGPMKRYLHAAMDQAFSYAADRDKRQSRPGTFVVVAESLGSFIVFDAYARGHGSVREVLNDTAYLYFFANQLALMELGRLSEASPRPPSWRALLGRAKSPAASMSLHGALTAWSGIGRRSAGQGGRATYKQIIAFSDPSDALTFRVPKIDGLTVVNIYDRNEVDFLHLAANPIKAHIGHSANPHVLDLMLKR